MRDQNNIVDWTLGEKLANGNRALAKELFDMLLETLPQHKQEIQTAYDKKILLNSRKPFTNYMAPPVTLVPFD